MTKLTHTIALIVVMIFSAQSCLPRECGAPRTKSLRGGASLRGLWAGLSNFAPVRRAESKALSLFDKQRVLDKASSRILLKIEARYGFFPQEDKLITYMYRMMKERLRPEERNWGISGQKRVCKNERPGK